LVSLKAIDQLWLIRLTSHSGLQTAIVVRKPPNA
jgi:hypothetical protein